MSATGELRHDFVRANGLRFHVAACEPAAGGDRLALFLHGFPECWYSWRAQLPLLAALGWRAWAPDLRGYGESDRPAGVDSYAIERLLDDVSGLIAASGARDTLLVGHDWGGIVAWYFAMRRPEEIARLCIMNLPHPACMERAFRRGPQLLRSWYALFFQLPWLPEKLLAAGDYRAIRRAFSDMAVDGRRFPSEVLEVYRDNAARPGALTAMLNYYRALVRGGSRRQRALGYPRIERPTLMLWGEQDAALGIETTYGTEEFVSDLVLRYLPGVSHWVQQEAPETVNAMLEAWLLGKPVPNAWELSEVAKIVVYGPRLNPFVDKVLRGLALKKLEHRLVEPNGPEDYRKWNPETGLLPVADVSGRRVADSHRILDVVDERWPEPPFVAADPKVSAAQRNLEQWVSETFLFYWEHYLRQRMQEIEDGEAERAEGALARFGILRRRSGPGAANRRYAAEYAQRIGDLANFLGTRPFFYAERISRADLAVYSFLRQRTVGSVPESIAAVTGHRGLVDWLARVAEETRAADV